MYQADGEARAVTLIGDVVGSRRHSERGALQRRLVSVLADVESRIASVQPLAATVGDEFQGAYPDLPSAVRAALSVRLLLLPEVDVRFGLGAGAFTVFDADSDPISQDGPAWWAARDAITTAKRRAARPRSRSTRTWYAVAADVAPEGPAGPGVVNAYLSCCDEILGRMSARELRLTRGLLLGAEQAEMAQSEGVGQSAVSQALSRSGAHTIVGSLGLLSEEISA